MARFKHEKARLLSLISTQAWARNMSRELADQRCFRAAVNPLFSFLARPEARWQAAWSLGKGMGRLARESMEDARVIMRRIMWNLNEDSGNLGWGMPEAMGCILAGSPPLAREYGRMLLSYIQDTGRADNYLEYAPLRQGAYWAAGRLAGAAPEQVLPSLPSLARGLEDEDIFCRGCAAFACKTLAASLSRAGCIPPFYEGALWRTVCQGMKGLADAHAELTLLEGDDIITRSIAEWADVGALSGRELAG